MNPAGIRHEPNPLERRVLFVEDSNTYTTCFQVSIGYWLEQQHIAVDYASNERQASQYMANHPYSLVITDGSLSTGHDLGPLEGVRVARQAKDIGAKTIGLSLEARRFKQEAGNALDTVYSKPYDIIQVQETISAYLGLNNQKR